MVAGPSFHRQRQRDISPLQAIKSHERCSFTFGPSVPTISDHSMMYPAGVAQSLVLLSISAVTEEVPGLLSRQAFNTLHAIPDIVTGTIHYVALNRTAPLYLTECGHIAVRIDEWPSDMCEHDWPIENDNQLEIVAPEASKVDACALTSVSTLQARQLPFLEPKGTHLSSVSSRSSSHAGSASSTLAEEVAAPPQQLAGVHLQHQQPGAPLCRTFSAACSEGSCPSPLSCRLDGKKHVTFDDGGGVSRLLEDFGVSSSTRSLPSRHGSQELWSRRVESEDVHAVRQQVGGMEWRSSQSGSKIHPGSDAPLNVPQWIKDSRDKQKAAKEAKKEIVKTEKMTAAKTAAQPSGRRSSSSVPSSSLSEASLQQHQQRAQPPRSKSSAAASSGLTKEEADWGADDQPMDFTSDNENEMALPVDSTLGSWDDVESVSMISGRSGRTRKIGTLTVDEEDI